MELVSSLETPDSQSQAAVPLSPNTYVPPTLRGGECYHVFISYSSTDYQWTHSVINQLESCGLQVCYHERDFTPGRTVLENMSDCIQESQKVLLVLSPEFVRSRWCLPGGQHVSVQRLPGEETHRPSASTCWFFHCYIFFCDGMSLFSFDDFIHIWRLFFQNQGHHSF
uniref:TIR domain-containing protein n=1 Tax=Scophthalmus maximus TaxID=52904 RepID=A0A8D3A093_SCOMX